MIFINATQYTFSTSLISLILKARKRLLRGESLMEQAIIFGQYDHLLGISHITKQRDASDTAMIFITAGMLHNVGPYRMYVDIAYKLAEQGVSSLRFDISGIGDSLGVGTAGKPINRAASEASEAMDYLSEKHDIKHFILFGLCSGADDSVQAALDDERVKGVIALDGLGYKTLQFKLRHILQQTKKMHRPEKWLSKFKKLGLSSKLAPATLAMGTDVREFPQSLKQATKELQQLIDRNTQLHFIYTGGTNYYNYAQQFYDMLPDVKWKGTESTQFFPHMDHVATLLEDRKQLVEHVTTKTLQMIYEQRQD